MNPPEPHFLLLADVSRRNDQDEWNFVLQGADGTAIESAQEFEPNQHGERLELLSVVRGLEALDQPSRVTLVTRSKYVRRGIAFGLDEWRGNDWTWECYGEMVPVKNRDLWQRLDRAMNYHQIELRTWRLDAAHATNSSDCFKTACSEGDSPLLGGTRKMGTVPSGFKTSSSDLNTRTETERPIPAPHFLRRQASEAQNLREQTVPRSAAKQPRAEEFELVAVESRRTERAAAGKHRRRRALAGTSRWGSELVNWLLLKLQTLGTRLLPSPWFDEGQGASRWIEQKLGTRLN